MIKKSLLVILVLFLGTGIVGAKNVTIDKARQAGINFYYEKINISHQADFSSIRVNDIRTEVYDGINVYYAINFSGGGFVIVSADDAVTPVLVYSFEGSCTGENQPPQYTEWMEGYSKQIANTRKLDLPAVPGVAEAWAHLLTDDISTLSVEKGTRNVEPLLISTWDQGANYNNLCPADPNGPGGHVWAGCVATAMCQIMYYYRYPQTGVGQHCYTPAGYPEQCADFGNTTYRWNEMLNSHPTADTATEILLWHAGVAVNMMYSSGGSGAYSQDAAEAMKNYFRYNPGTQLLFKDNYSETDWQNILIANLDQKHPLYYHGFGTAGHAFNVDGYQGTDYFHFNWGWSGSYNGYYYLNNLNPGGQDFSYGQGAIVDCYPDSQNNTYPYYCTGQTVMTRLSGTFEDGSGPIDYLDNSDCSWLIQPTGISDSVTSIKLTFNRFSTEEGSDIVSVYQGNTQSSSPVATFSGDQVPPVLTVEGNQALVTFTSNGSGTKPGWFISYSAATMNWCKTAITLTDNEGTFSDGSFNFNYQNHSNCRWIIKPSDTGSVILDFTAFNTEAGHDFVKVFDLPTMELLSVISGNYDASNLPPPVIGPSGQLFVIFVSDGTNTDAGFDAHYKNAHVGIDENNVAQEIVVYPNPATSKVNVRFPDAKMNSIRAELIGIDGKTVLSTEFRNLSAKETRQLDVSSVPAGIYILRLIGDKSVATRKLIIE